jgi:hypothetical protein
MRQEFAHLESIIDHLVDELVREIESQNDNGLGSQQTKPQAVKDQRGESTRRYEQRTS